MTQINAIGDWLGICGDAIYATRPWAVAGEGPTENVRDNYGTAEDFRFTTKGDDIYAIAFGWPENDSWLITSFTSAALPNVSRVSVVGGDELAFSQTESGLEVTAPAAQPYPNACVLKIERNQN